MEKEKIISVTSLPNVVTLNSLKEYNLFLKSIFIKQLKCLTNGGSMSLISCNSLERIEITDEICKLINAIILKIPCFSIYSGIIMSSVLIKLWTEPLSEYSKTNVINALLEFQLLLESSLEHMKIEDRMVDINFLQGLIVPVLSEEPLLCLDESFLRKVSLQVVKAVLSVSDIEKNFKLGHITIHIEQGHDECFVANGVLCEIDDSNAKLVKSDFTNSLKSPCKIILFAENLDFKGTLDTFVEKMVENNIKIVVCQKKISDILKLYLNRRRILLIERTGEEIAKSLELLTGGTLIRDLKKIELNDIVTFVGDFSYIRHLCNRNTNKIFIENQGNYITLIYVQCRSFSDITILKAVINKCVHLLGSALSSPFFLPGPVLFETSLSSILNLKLTSNFLLKQITEDFRNILKEVCSLYEGSMNKNSDFLKHCYFLKRNAFVHIYEGIVSILSIAHIIKQN